MQSAIRKEKAEAVAEQSNSRTIRGCVAVRAELTCVTHKNHRRPLPCKKRAQDWSEPQWLLSCQDLGGAVCSVQCVDAVDFRYDYGYGMVLYEWW